MVRLTNYHQELSDSLSIPLQRFLRFRKEQRVVERLCQVAIECAMDLATLILEVVGHPPPPSGHAAFHQLESLKILPSHLSKKFQTYVGFRNRIVHDYDTLKPDITYRSAHALLNDLLLLIRYIQKWLEKGSLQQR